MLKAAQKRLDGVDNVDLRNGDLEALPIDDGECDAAMMVLVLTYVASPEAAIREMARILKPGGKVVLIDLLPHGREDFRRQMEQQHAGFEPAAMEQMMSDAGLSKVVCRPLQTEPNVKGPALFIATGTTPFSGGPEGRV